MEMTSTRARLVDTLPEGALSTTVSRSEIEDALNAEEPPELILEVRRDSEEKVVTVAWEKADLERLLSDATADAVMFSFDREELVKALDAPDVEGHGLRETAAILTIAAAAAAGASTAAAAPDLGTGIAGSGAAIETQAPVDAGTGIQAAAAAADATTIADRGIDVQRAAAAAPSDSSSDLAAAHWAKEAAASAPDASLIVDRGIEAQRGLEATAAAADASLIVDRGVDVQSARSAEASLIVDRGIEVQRAASLASAETPPPSDGGWSIEAPSFDATTAAVAGGVGGALLLITAAGFSMRRPRGARPA
jgi:hypothetical protein